MGLFIPSVRSRECTGGLDMFLWCFYQGCGDCRLSSDEFWRVLADDFSEQGSKGETWKMWGTARSVSGN
jgi:hypothetical protein